jgi:hypothetical protein
VNGMASSVSYADAIRGDGGVWTSAIKLNCSRARDCGTCSEPQVGYCIAASRITTTVPLLIIPVELAMPRLLPDTRFRLAVVVERANAPIWN